ncbi:MAG: 4-hydroxy-tetrahydrodipicolinate synthase [Nocardioidaceae bacterium]
MTDSFQPPAPFGRVLTAMVTPFTDDGIVDLEQAQRVAEHLIDHGHDGLVVLGTTGEAPTIAEPEAARLLTAVVEAVGDRATIVAGVGTNNTGFSIELAVQAEKCGVGGLLVVTPYYSKPPQEGLVRHFKAVADSTELPVMLYDIPSRAGIRISDETFDRVAEHDRIVAVKDAVGDLVGGSRVMHRTGLVYYSGDDALNLGWLTHGAAGLVSVVGHVAGDDHKAMVEYVGKGDLVAAQAIYRRLLPAVEAIMTRTQGCIMVKAALELAGIMPNRTVRLPMIEATDAQVEQLRRDLVLAGLLEDTAA